jgi:putative chitinase
MEAVIITPDRLAQLAPAISRTVSDQLAGALTTAMPEFGVTGALPCAHFLAQACYESRGFTRFEENLNYTSAARIAAIWPRLALRAADLVGNPQALANAAYGGRGGNGDEASGDGFRFRGRGAFQLTGRTNYSLAGSAIGHDLENNPDQAAEPDMAVLTALWFWRARHCNGPAMNDDAEGVTRIINGPAREGLSQRRDLTERAKHIFT